MAHGVVVGFEHIEWVRPPLAGGLRYHVVESYKVKVLAAHAPHCSSSLHGFSAMTQRVAIVGIDGAGKSSVADLVARALSQRGTTCEQLHCPLIHHHPNAPLADLSRTLETLSAHADTLDDPLFKAAIMVDQMTLFGPAERFLVSTLTPEVLVCSRQPVIATLVYAQLYARLGTEPAADAGIAERPACIAPHAWQRLERWRALRSGPSGRPRTAATLAHRLASLVSDDLASALRTLEHDLQSAMPDVAVLLDVDPQQAYARACQRLTLDGDEERRASPELPQHADQRDAAQRLSWRPPASRQHRQGLERHERPELLAQLATNYRKLFAVLPQLYPKSRLRCEIVAVDGSTTAEQTATAIVEQL